MINIALVVRTEKRQEAYWVLYIKQRIKKMKNFLGIFTGATGSGKSWSALSLCFQVDDTFTPERIVFSMKGLMKLINEDKVKSGQAILWDESGIDVSNRSWQSLTNRMVNFLLQTFRHKRIILIMTTPYLDFVDASTRKLFHAEISTLSINTAKKSCKVKPMILQYNSRKKKFYYKYLRACSPKKSACPVKSWNIPAPPQWLIDEYEVMKTNFTAELNKDIEQQLEGDKPKKKDERKPLTEKQENVLKLLAEYKGNMDKTAKKIGLKLHTIWFHKTQARKKGYSWEEYMEKQA